MDPRPTALTPDLLQAPHELKVERRWVGWRFENRDGRWTKVPVRIDGRAKEYHRLARTDDPSTWGDFVDACRAVDSHKVDGVGFVLGDGFAGADLDKCRDPETGATDPRALKVMAALAGAWWEVSPSGTGWKCFCLVADTNLRGFEIRYNVDNPRPVAFQGARYFAFTGRPATSTPPDHLPSLTNVMAPFAEVQPIPEQLALTLQASRPAWIPTGNEGWEDLPKVRPTSEFTDDEIINIARRAPNGGKFQALFDGGRLDLHGMDHSRADAALLTILAFWTGRDPERMARLFTMSKLMRSKWNVASYRRASIAKALRSCTQVWEPELDPAGGSAGRRRMQDLDAPRTTMQDLDTPQTPTMQDLDPPRPKVAGDNQPKTFIQD